jgi:hypothetical protein
MKVTKISGVGVWRLPNKNLRRRMPGLQIGQLRRKRNLELRGTWWSGENQQKEQEAMRSELLAGKWTECGTLIARRALD